MNTEEYKGLFEQSPALEVVIDTNFNIVAASNAFLKVTRVKREGIVGRNIFDVFPDNPNDITADGESKIRASFNRVIKNKTPDALPVVKYDIPKPESEVGGFEVKYWKTISSPLLDANNNVKYIILRSVEVTENETLVEQLDQEKKIAEAFKTANDYIRNIFMQAPALVCMLRGPEHIYELANEKYLKLVGNKDIIGKPIREAFPELKGQGFFELLDEVYISGKSFVGNEMPAKFQSGNGKQEDVYLDFVYQATYDDNGKIDGILVHGINVTEHVLSRKKIEDSEKRYNMMLMKSQFAFAVLKGKNKVITLANDRVKKIWGKGMNIEGKSLLEIMPELKDTPFPALLDEVYATGIPYHGVDIQSPKDPMGELKDEYFNFVFQPYLETDETISGITIIGYEVTASVMVKKASEAQHEAEQKALKQIADSEKRYNMMLMQSPFSFAVLKGKNRVITFANDRFKETWGKGKNIEGKPLIDVLPELKDTPFITLIDEVYKTGIPYHGNETLAPKHIKGQTEDVYYNFVYQPYHEADETISGVTIIACEVTSTVIVKKALEAQHELEQKTLKQIADSEKRYSLMLMRSPFGFAVFKGKSMVITMANDTIKEIWGKGKDVEGKPLFDVVPELKDSAYPGLLDNVYTTGVPFQGNDLLAPLLRSGKLEDAYFNLVYQPYLEADESISGVTVIAYEVTAQVVVKKALEAQQEAEKRALKLVEETNARYYTMLMQSPFAFSIMKGKDMVITLANDLIKEFWGKGMDVEGKTLLQVLPELKDQPFPEMIDQVFTTGEPIYVNEILAKLQHNGKLEDRYFNIVYQPHYEADNTISGVVTIAYDVTEMILARKKIEESDKRYNMMLMNSPFSFAVLKGKDLVIELANDQIKEVWGRGKDIEGKSLLEIMPELKDSSFPALLDEVRATGIPFHGIEVQSPKNMHGHIKEEYFFNFVFQPYLETDQTISGITIIGNDVTEQVIAKRKIEESEERFRSLVEKSPYPISIFKGKELKMEVANEPLLKIFNVGKEVLGKPLLEILPEMKEQPFMALLLDVLENGATHYGSEQPAYFLRENGEKDTRYFNFVYQPYRENDRSVSGVMSLATDVTEQVLARKKIEAQVIMHEEMLMNAPYVACTLEGPNHVFSLVNEQYQQLFGSRILKGKPFLKALPEMEGQGFDKLLDKIYNTGETYVGFDIPVTFAREEGHTPELGYFNFSYQAMFDENRKIYSILGFGYEVTEIVKAKLIIEESELQFRVLTNSMPQKITNADAAGNMIFFNQKWLDDTGLTFDELKDWGWEKSIHTDDLKLTAANWKHSVATGDVFDMECRIQNKEGDYRWHLSRAVPIRDKNGKIVMWVGSNTDIQEQKEQKEGLQHAVAVRTLELSEANEELKKKNKELEAFTYVSSHDLQEPLRKIQTFAGRILEKEYQHLSDKGKDEFRRIQEAAARMQQLIEDLLAFSRINTTERKFVKTGLNQIIEEVKTELKDTIDKTHAIIEAIEICPANIIAFQFHQLLYNLIGNALKFANPDIPPHIIIKSRIIEGNKLNNPKLSPLKNYCHITIADNGIGFEPHFSERIFEVFQKLHDKEEYAGTGIGLAIVKKIVENHQGIITATSHLNKGATFDIYIPAN